MKGISIKLKFIILLLFIFNFSYSYATDIPTIKVDCEPNQNSFLQAVCNDIYKRSGEKFIPSYSSFSQGGQGKVFLLKWSNDNLCIKIAHQPPSQLSKDEKNEHSIYYKITGLDFEGNFLKHIRNSKTPNLAFPVAGYESSDFYATVSGYKNLCPLYDILKKNLKLKETHVASIIYDILQGLNCLHNAADGQKWVHYDISSGNILLHGIGQKVETFLIDAGTVRPIKPGLKLRDAFHHYNSPENMLYNTDYNDKSEVFVVGVLFWELIYGECPFAGLKFGGISFELHKDILNSLPYYLNTVKNDNNLSQNCKDILIKLLNPDPNLRISTSDALKHDFFKSRQSIKSDILN